jgi:superfamily II RNA helicase
MVSRGYLDDMSFPEIMAILSAFINEKDGGSEEKYISDLKVPSRVSTVLNKMKNLGEYFISKEEKCGLYIQSDYNLYLDFVEPAYIWADGGTIRDIYNVTSVYDGNFVKAIMRLNNVCDNLKDICMTMKRYDLCEKMENSTSLLIRDITSINSLYVK